MTTEEAASGEQPVVRIPRHFETFYRQEYGSVLGLTYSLSGSRAAAEDLTQEAFLRAHRDWDNVGRYEYPGAWVRRVASNLAMSRFRRLKSEAKAVTRLAGFGTPPPPPTIAPEYEHFWREVRSLPRRQAQVVALFYLEDLSIAQIAATLAVAEGTVKAQLHKARTTLARRLGADVGEHT